VTGKKRPAAATAIFDVTAAYEGQKTFTLASKSDIILALDITGFSRLTYGERFRGVFRSNNPTLFTRHLSPDCHI